METKLSLVMTSREPPEIGRRAGRRPKFFQQPGARVFPSHRRFE